MPENLLRPDFMRRDVATQIWNGFDLFIVPVREMIPYPHAFIKDSLAQKQTSFCAIQDLSDGQL